MQRIVDPRIAAALRAQHLDCAFWRTLPRILDAHYGPGHPVWTDAWMPYLLPRYPTLCRDLYAYTRPLLPTLTTDSTPYYRAYLLPPITTCNTFFTNVYGLTTQRSLPFCHCRSGVATTTLPSRLHARCTHHCHTFLPFSCGSYG